MPPRTAALCNQVVDGVPPKMTRGFGHQMLTVFGFGHELPTCSAQQKSTCIDMEKRPAKKYKRIISLERLKNKCPRDKLKLLDKNC
jgi:hypothetical protein